MLVYQRVQFKVQIARQFPIIAFGLGQKTRHLNVHQSCFEKMCFVSSYTWDRHQVCLYGVYIIWLAIWNMCYFP